MNTDYSFTSSNFHSLSDEYAHWSEDCVRHFLPSTYANFLLYILAGCGAFLGIWMLAFFNVILTLKRIDPKKRAFFPRISEEDLKKYERYRVLKNKGN